MNKVEVESKKFANKHGLKTRKSKNGIFFNYKHKFDDIKNFESYISFQEQDEDIKFALDMVKQDLDNFKYRLNSYMDQKEVSLKKYYPTEYRKVKAFVDKN